MLDVLLVVEVGNWEKIDVWVAGIAAGLLVLVLIVTSITAKAAMGAAGEARRANDAAAVERRLRLRPWVGISLLKASRVIHEDGSVTLAEGGQLTIARDLPDSDVIGYEFNLINYGQSPALQVGISKEYAESLSELEEKLKESEGLHEGSILPSEINPQAFPIPYPDQKVALHGDGL